MVGSGLELRVNAVIAAFPLVWGFESAGLYEHCTQLIFGSLTVQAELHAILGEQAAERYKHGERCGRLYQWWQDQTHGFGQWLDADDGFTPGERLCFVIDAGRKGDRDAAVACWRKFCDHDHWHKREFIQAFVETVVAKLDKKAA